MIRTGIPVFDSAVGGLVGQANHLFYGELGTGKSTFALQFLACGLGQGEPAALVTRRSGRDVLLHAEAIGAPLQPYLRSGLLLLLEYSPEVIERVARARDFSQIAEEFDYFAQRRGTRRIVFDPLTPLIHGMNTSEAALRTRTLLQNLESHLATVVFVLDVPEANGLVESCKDFMTAVVHFETPSEPKAHPALVLERFVGVTNGHRRIPFEWEANRGIVEAPPNGLTPEEVQQKRILVACTDRGILDAVRQLLTDEYSVTTCQDMIQVMAQLASQNHDLLIVDTDIRDNSSVRACLELRNNQFNLPILLLVAGQQKRLRDRLALLARGIDDCVEKPFDGRLLRVRVHSLLKRYSLTERFRKQETDQVVLAGLKRFAHEASVLTDLDVFGAALEEEVGHAQQFAVPFCVCLFEFDSSEKGNAQEAACAVQRLLRPLDRVFANGTKIAVLLVETNSSGAEAFLRRAGVPKHASVPPRVRTFAYDGSAEFVPEILVHIAGESTGSEATGEPLEVT